MKERIKQNFGYVVAVFAAFVLLGSSGIYAAEWNAINEDTGEKSTNEVKVDIKNKIDIKQDNKNNIDNYAKVDANTGENEANRNDDDGEVNTGEIDLAFEIANMLGFDGHNNGCSDNDHLCCPFGGELVVKNEDTGENSYNMTVIKAENKLKVKVKSDTKIDNNINAKLNTGENQANRNDGDGMVTTGSVSFDSLVTNKVNNPWTIGVEAMCCPFGGDISVINEDTGEKSENESAVSIKNDVKIGVKNKTDINNNIKLAANTGNNEASRNDGDGVITTGDISATLALTNWVANK